MTKSKMWSQKDLIKVSSIITTAILEGKTRGEATQEAATHFGVSTNAISIRYGRWRRGLKGKKKSTTKTPIIRKKGVRGPYTKNTAGTSLKEDDLDTINILNKKTYQKKYKKNLLVDKVLNAQRSITFDIKETRVDLQNGKITFSW